MIVMVVTVILGTVIPFGLIHYLGVTLRGNTNAKFQYQYSATTDQNSEFGKSIAVETPNCETTTATCEDELLSNTIVKCRQILEEVKNLKPENCQQDNLWFELLQLYERKLDIVCLKALTEQRDLLKISILRYLPDCELGEGIPAELIKKYPSNSAGERLERIKILDRQIVQAQDLMLIMFVEENYLKKKMSEKK